MRHRVAFLIAAAALLALPGVSAPRHSPHAPRHSSHKEHRRSHKTTRGGNESWDPGYTFSNPFGLPKWVRRPRR